MKEFSCVSVILALEALRFTGKTEESLRCLRTLRLDFIIIIFIASIIILFDISVKVLGGVLFCHVEYLYKLLLHILSFYSSFILVPRLVF